MKFRLVDYIRGQWRRVASIPGGGEGVARGLALGIGLGFTPLYGLKTLLALVIAPLLRGNRTAAVVGTTLHDITLPLMPALLRFEYDLGFWLLQRPHRWPAHLHLHHLQAHDWMTWTTFVSVALPLLLGSVIVAIPVALLTYLVLRRMLASTQSTGVRKVSLSA